MIRYKTSGTPQSARYPEMRGGERRKPAMEIERHRYYHTRRRAVNNEQKGKKDELKAEKDNENRKAKKKKK